MDVEPGTDFEAAQGGGFDEGVGTNNVSSEVQADNLVIWYLVSVYTLIFYCCYTLICQEDPIEKSEKMENEKGEVGDEDEQDEAAVTMSQDFGGDVTDIAETEEEEDEGIYKR